MPTPIGACPIKPGSARNDNQGEEQKKWNEVGFAQASSSKKSLSPSQHGLTTRRCGGETLLLPLRFRLLLLLDIRHDSRDLLQRKVLQQKPHKSASRQGIKIPRSGKGRTRTFPNPSMTARSIFFAPVCTTSRRLLTANLMLSSWFIPSL